MRKAADRARAALGASLASVTRQQATTKFARTNRERFEELSKDGAVSASERDQAMTEADVAEATIRVVEDRWKRPGGGHQPRRPSIRRKRNEDGPYHRGYTPSQRPSRAGSEDQAVTEGALVMAQTAGALATIQQLDPMYVDMPHPRPSCCGYRAAWRTAVSVTTGSSGTRSVFSLKTTPNIPWKGRFNSATSR